MEWNKETAEFIRACMKVNPGCTTDVAFRAFKVVQGNLKIRLPKPKEDKDV